MEYDGKQVVIRDLGSMNGILVDGDRIQGSRYLVDGAHITLGPFTSTLRLAADEKDPSRVASMMPNETRYTLNDFTPSTDRANRETIDSGQPVPTPAQAPKRAPERKSPSVGGSAALTERRHQSGGERRIAPLIEEALREDEDSHTISLNEREIVTEMLMPSQEQVSQNLRLCCHR